MDCGGITNDMKQVIVINEALKLPRGKLAAQVARASVAAFLAADSVQRQAWIDTGMPKIVLSARDDVQVLDMHKKALDAGLPTELVEDAGRTVVVAGTVTCTGIGPAPEKAIDGITGALALVR